MNPDDTPSRQDTVGRFFDQLTDDYTKIIERCFPRYREMLWALLEYLPSDAQPRNILELGCGTGNLSVLLSTRYENATIRMIDISSDSLQSCEQRFSSSSRLVFQQADFRELEFDESQFDLIISSIAVHHLTSEEKRVMFGKIDRWLARDGVFAYADQHAGADRRSQPQTHRKLESVVARSRFHNGRMGDVDAASTRTRPSRSPVRSNRLAPQSRFQNGRLSLAVLTVGGSDLSEVKCGSNLGDR